MNSKDYEIVLEEERKLAYQTSDVLRKLVCELEKIVVLSAHDYHSYICTARRLAHFASARFEGVLELISCGRPWDAEIVLRSGCEATLKILFLSYCDDAEREKRIEEFWVLSTVDNIRKQRNRAGVRQICNPEERDDNSAFSVSDKYVFEGIIHFSDLAADSLPKIGRKQRQRISQKWAFTSMVEDIDQYLIGEKGLPSVTSLLLHNYGISSSLIHADETGVGLVYERVERSDEEYLLLHKAHCCRMMSDVLALFGCIAMGLSNVFDAEQLVLCVVESIEKLMETFEKHQNEFYATQKDFYDGILSSKD